MAEDQQFYIGQKAVIEKDGKVLVLNDPVFGADLPGGKIQVGETDFVASLKREVFEETGLEIIIGKPFHTGHFIMSSSLKGRQRKNAGKRIFIVYFIARYVSGRLRLSEEHNGYQWIDKQAYHILQNDKIGEVTKALEVYFTIID